MISFNNIISIILAIIPFMYQILAIDIFNGIIKEVQYIGIIVLDIILIFYHIKNNIRIRIELFKLSIPLFMATVFIPIATYRLNPIFLNRNISVIGLYLVFIMMLVLLGNYVTDKNKYYMVIKSLMIGNGIPLIISFIINIDIFSITNLANNLNSILFNTGRVRFDFGYNHPNTAAIYIICQILLTTIYFYEKNNNKMIYISNMVFILALILTGSRTPILAIFIYILSRFIILLISKFRGKAKVSIILSIIIIFILSNNIYREVINNTYSIDSMIIRNSEVFHNIKQLIVGNYIMFGIGPVSHTGINDFGQGLLSVDNGYISILTQFGISGLVLILGVIIYTVIRCLNRDRLILIPLIIAFLFYCTTESTLFVTGVLLTMIMWLLIFLNEYI